MLKNYLLTTILFFFSFIITNQSLAGGRSSKPQPERWIVIAKPKGEDLSLWNWLSNKYQIVNNTYEDDIEFALPKGWQCTSSSDASSTVKNQQGLELFILIGSKDSSLTLRFFTRNINILRDAV